MATDMHANILTFSADDIVDNIRELGALLRACVHDGASIGFVLPFEAEESEAYWRKKVLPGTLSGTCVLLVARQDGKIAGTVQLDTDTMPNQPHRAEVRKLMVHPDFRGRGIARALMAELEQRASRSGRGLLTLDTRTGDKAEPLYVSLGYTPAGAIPGYCLDPSRDQLDSTTIMYKRL